MNLEPEYLRQLRMIYDAQLENCPPKLIVDLIDEIERLRSLVSDSEKEGALLMDGANAYVADMMKVLREQRNHIEILEHVVEVMRTAR